MHTDASGKGLGTVLEQEADDGQPHPVVKRCQNMSVTITELEALGVIWALCHFQAYLLGHSCVIVTDHAPLKALLKACHQSGKLARWSQTIAEFDVEIRYWPGRVHGNAEALSRSPMENVAAELAGGVNQVAVGRSEMAEQQRQDPKLKVLVDYKEQGVLPSDERLTMKTVVESSQFSLMDGILYFVDDGGRGSISRLWLQRLLKRS